MSSIQERRQASLAHLKVGAWYSHCCHLDLYEIEDEEDLESVRDFLMVDDEPEMWPRVWPSRRDALLTLRDEWKAPGEEEELAAIERLLAEDT